MLVCVCKRECLHAHINSHKNGHAASNYLNDWLSIWSSNFEPHESYGPVCVFFLLFCSCSYWVCDGYWFPLHCWFIDSHSEMSSDWSNMFYIYIIDEKPPQDKLRVAQVWWFLFPFFPKFCLILCCVSLLRSMSLHVFFQISNAITIDRNENAKSGKVIEITWKLKFHIGGCFRYSHRLPSTVIHIYYSNIRVMYAPNTYWRTPLWLLDIYRLIKFHWHTFIKSYEPYDIQWKRLRSVVEISTKCDTAKDYCISHPSVFLANFFSLVLGIVTAEFNR